MDSTPSNEEGLVSHRFKNLLTCFLVTRCSYVIKAIILRHLIGHRSISLELVGYLLAGLLGVRTHPLINCVWDGAKQIGTVDEERFILLRSSH